MQIALSVLGLLVSFAFIAVITEEYFIPSLENIAGWLKMPSNVAGATLLAFGSSAPELFTSLMTLLILGSRPAFGVGNIIGSALFQILVVIGFAALLRSATLAWRPVVRDGAVYGLAVVLLFFFVRDNRLTLLEGGIMVGAYGAYLVFLLAWPRIVGDRGEQNTGDGDADEQPADNEGFIFRLFSRLSFLVAPVQWLLRPIPQPAERPGWTIPVFLISLIGLGGSTYLLVRAGETLAAALGLDPAIVALTVIAGGSSVPELVSSSVVAQRGKSDMAIANALGSNTFDIFVSLGLPVLLATLIYGPVEQIGGANITSSTLLLLATLAMVVGLLAVQRFRARRAFGLVLIAAYVLYVVAAYRGWLAA